MRAVFITIRTEEGKEYAEVELKVTRGYTREITPVEAGILLVKAATAAEEAINKMRTYTVVSELTTGTVTEKSTTDVPHTNEDEDDEDGD